MRLGRARVARGLPPDRADETDMPGGFIGAGPGSQAFQPEPPPSAPLEITAGVPPALPPDTAAGSVDLGPRFRPWSEPAQAASGPIRCHFLRSVGPDGRLADAQNSAVPTHRCAAFGDPLPLSLRQQELVCLQRVHVSCPRYVRGTLLANAGAATTAPDDEKAGFPLMTVAAVVLVIAALGILVTGPILGVLPFGGAGHQAPIIAGGSPSPAQSATPKPSIAVSPSPVVTPATSPATTPSAQATPKATPTPVPSPSPTPTATPKPTPTPAWPPGATASRMNLVAPCPGQANCYVYTVRGAGQNGSSVADTLPNIATFFGVQIAKIRQMNPSLASSDVIHPGDQLKIPPPTR